MAILIPSKNIYENQNPKVRDNVIERVEVGAVEVVPNNEYETPVYNSQQIVDKSAMKAMSTIQRNTVGNVISYSGMGSGFSCNIASIEVFDIKTIHLSISIKKIQKNSLVSKIYYEKDNEGNNQIKYSIFGKTNKGTCSQSITWSQPSGVWVGEGEATFSNYGKISFTEDTIGQEENRIDLYSTFSYTKEKEYSNSAVTSNFTPQDVSNVTSFVELEDMYLIDIDFVVSMKVAKLGGFGDTITNGGYNTTLTGTYEEYIPTEIEITVYGNTIGIDLTDKTVYINGETQKKVHSIEGNELMQMSNYIRTQEEVVEQNPSGWSSSIVGGGVGYSYVQIKWTRNNSSRKETLKSKVVYNYSFAGFDDSGEKEVSQIFEIGEREKTIYYGFNRAIATSFYIVEYSILYDRAVQVDFIDSAFKRTMASYSNGKETATIRCSIGDYYDYEGQKIISIDNSTGKMSFKMYDQVIPMVYGADGKDRPMSLYKDGSAKVFQVLGSKIFYDGAVWQELSLQEVDKIESS